MTEIEAWRKRINLEQSSLRKALKAHGAQRAWMDRFNAHHAMLHSQRASDVCEWSYEDALLDDLEEAKARIVPAGEEHSIAWAIWHVARIEDAVMNLLVAGTPQVLHTGDWQAKLKVPDIDSGNELASAAIVDFSRAVDFGSLREYRAAVGRRTQEIVRKISPAELMKRVDSERLHLVMKEGVLVEAASGIRDYWGRQTIAGLLLMPASRHILTHLNEVLALKRKIR